MTGAREGKVFALRSVSCAGTWESASPAKRVAPASGGFTSESLVKFGFRPRRINRRRPVVEKPAPQEPKPAPTDGAPAAAAAK